MLELKKPIPVNEQNYKYLKKTIRVWVDLALLRWKKGIAAIAPCAEEKRVIDQFSGKPLFKKEEGKVFAKYLNALIKDPKNERIEMSALRLLNRSRADRETKLSLCIGLNWILSMQRGDFPRYVLYESAALLGFDYGFRCIREVEGVFGILTPDYRDVSYDFRHSRDMFQNLAVNARLLELEPHFIEMEKQKHDMLRTAYRELSKTARRNKKFPRVQAVEANFYFITKAGEEELLDTDYISRADAPFEYKPVTIEEVLRHEHGQYAFIPMQPLCRTLYKLALRYLFKADADTFMADTEGGFESIRKQFRISVRSHYGKHLPQRWREYE